MEAVTLDGTGSTSVNGPIVSYLWSQGATILGYSAVQVAALPVGVHTIDLTITDSTGATNKDSVVITIEAPTIVARAGDDLVVTDADGDGAETVTLDGSASWTAWGPPASYLWAEGGTFLGPATLAFGEAQQGHRLVVAGKAMLPTGFDVRESQWSPAMTIVLEPTGVLMLGGPVAKNGHKMKLSVKLKGGRIDAVKSTTFDVDKAVITAGAKLHVDVAQDAMADLTAFTSDNGVAVVKTGKGTLRFGKAPTGGLAILEGARRGSQLMLFSFHPPEHLAEVHLLDTSPSIRLLPRFFHPFEPQPSQLDIVFCIVKRRVFARPRLVALRGRFLGRWRGIGRLHRQAVAPMAKGRGHEFARLPAGVVLGRLGIVSQGGLGAIGRQPAQIVVATSGQFGVGRDGRLLEQRDRLFRVARRRLRARRVERKSGVVGLLFPGRRERFGGAVEFPGVVELDSLSHRAGHVVDAGMNRAGPNHQAEDDGRRDPLSWKPEGHA